MKKNTKPAKTDKPLNVFKLKAGTLKMIHGGGPIVHEIASAGTGSGTVA